MHRLFIIVLSPSFSEMTTIFAVWCINDEVKKNEQALNLSKKSILLFWHGHIQYVCILREIFFPPWFKNAAIP